MTIETEAVPVVSDTTGRHMSCDRGLMVIKLNCSWTAAHHSKRKGQF
jgi:hypothetical protein